tara:strand:- start:943 stop:1110 length:168 start_codon:yes stop_codon:yes gene_type:complete
MKVITLDLACKLLGLDPETVFDEMSIHDLEEVLRDRFGGQWEMDLSKRMLRKVFY